MGSAYYRKLRSQYAVDNAKEHTLKPKDPDQKVNEDFKVALVALQCIPCKPAKLIEWCRHAEALNQRELCGLYKTQLMLRPSCSRPKHTRTERGTITDSESMHNEQLVISVGAIKYDGL
eukprot:12920683-Prorocentrum_lima.AAC.1